MDLKLNPEEMAAIASAAIFDQMSQESRDNVIQQAIKGLITPNTDRHTSMFGKSPLQSAFEDALRNAAYRAIEERVKNDPEVGKYISELLGPLLEGALTAEATVYKSDLSTYLGEALGRWLNEKARGD